MADLHADSFVLLILTSNVAQLKKVAYFIANQYLFNEHRKSQRRSKYGRRSMIKIENSICDNIVLSCGEGRHFG